MTQILVSNGHEISNGNSPHSPRAIKEIWLIRHGETEWTLSGAHTSRTDIPLTAAGREKAEAVGRFLAKRPFALVLSSPLARAYETCRLAGYGDVAVIEPRLREWNYGDYEGRTTPDIRKTRPDWFLWTSGVPNGEAIETVGARADAVIERAKDANAPEAGAVALFAHGHILRILASRWLGLPPQCGRLLALGTGTVSVLGYERETPVITRWNVNPRAYC